jgi:hypothetical protein
MPIFSCSSKQRPDDKILTALFVALPHSVIVPLKFEFGNSLDFGVWDLKFLWSLDLGAWIFGIRIHPKTFSPVISCFQPNPGYFPLKG